MAIIEATTAVVRSRPTVRALFLAAMLMGAVGLIAIGVSGLVAAAAGSTFGDRFVADEVAQTYSPARCAEYREYAPGAHTCLDVAASHHAGEIIEYRALAGVLGLLVLGVWAGVRRRGPRAPMPPMLVPAIGATAFATAAVGLLVFGLDRLVVYGTVGGAGGWLSGGVVAAAVTLWFGGRLVVALAAAVPSM